MTPTEPVGWMGLAILLQPVARYLINLLSNGDRNG